MHLFLFAGIAENRCKQVVRKPEEATVHCSFVNSADRCKNLCYIHFSLSYIRAKTEEPVRLTGDEISCVKNVKDSSSDWWQKSRKVLRGWSGSETFPVLDLIRSACYLSQCFSISSGKLIKLLDGACQPFLPQKVFLSK